MKPKLFSLNLAALLLLFLAACGSGAGGPGPRTWIDAPLDGSVAPLGPIIVRSHAGSDAGTVSAALMVNGAHVRLDEAADQSAELIDFAQTWEPETEGEYTLQVITTDTGGNQGRSYLVHIRIGDSPATEPVPSETPTQTPIGPTPTPTDTLATVPTFTFNTSANCRLGDSTAYEVADAFQQGDQATIEGRNAANTWFWILIPGASSHCWVSSSTGIAEGPTGNLEIVAPPLLPTDTPQAEGEDPDTQPEPGAPSAPGNLHVAGEVCDASEYKVTLEWDDVSGNEGYRVYRDGQLIATLGANANGFTDTPPNYNAHTYGVEAFNDAGSSARPSVQEDGCLF
ncbi:MAG: hypothetical protein WEC37_03270 [Anaerolineales bacterium]